MKSCCCVAFSAEPKGKLLPSPKKVEIKVISGQHLPKSDEQRLKGDIVEPYVKIRIRGHPRDDGEHITSVVPKVHFFKTLCCFITCCTKCRTDLTQLGTRPPHFSSRIPN